MKPTILIFSKECLDNDNIQERETALLVHSLNSLLKNEATVGILIDWITNVLSYHEFIKLMHYFNWLIDN